MRTVWIYVDTRKHVGDRDHLKVFTDHNAAEVWFAENNLEGVAFECEVIAGSPCFFERSGPSEEGTPGPSVGVLHVLSRSGPGTIPKRRSSQTVPT